MSRALGDPSLAVGRWDTEAERYVRASGELLDVPGAGSDRVVTFLERDGTALAAVVHDAVLLEDHGLLDSAGAAARFVVETDRLQAELKVRLEEVRAARARIVHTGDQARRRMERDLHDGAQQRLVSIMMDLKLTLARMDPSADPSLRIARPRWESANGGWGEGGERPERLVSAGSILRAGCRGVTETSPGRRRRERRR